MAKQKSITQEFSSPEPKKGSVLFRNLEPDALSSSLYLSRSAAAKHLGVSDLDTVKKIRVTVEVIE